MASTHKMLLLALFIQIVLGSIVTLGVQPEALPTTTLEGMDSFRQETLSDLQDPEGLQVLSDEDLVSSGEPGLSVIKAGGFLMSAFFNGFIIPYTYQPDGTYAEQLIVWGVRTYHAILMMFFALEAIMFFYSKKTS